MLRTDLGEAVKALSARKETGTFETSLGPNRNRLICTPEPQSRSHTSKAVSQLSCHDRLTATESRRIVAASNISSKKLKCGHCRTRARPAEMEMATSKIRIQYHRIDDEAFIRQKKHRRAKRGLLFRAWNRTESCEMSLKIENDTEWSVKMR